MQQLRIVVLGYIVRGPLGGHAWHHLHYVAGLAALGHDVWFFEDSDDYPSCYDPVLDITSADPTYGLEFAQRAFLRIGMRDRWSYFDGHTNTWFGPASGEMLHVCRSVDIVINLSGANPIPSWLHHVDVRVFIDTDPGFTQAEIILQKRARTRALDHTVFFTFAELVGRGATLPNDGIDWKATRQPIVLGLWPTRPRPSDGCFTTVMLWESYPPLEVNGMRLGLKAQSFGPYLEIPHLTGYPFELALGGSSAPHKMLARYGWRTRDPRPATRTLETYEDYIGGSLGEFSVAKDGYVVTRSGWFSERSANYLTMGRPVVTQDTGFSEVLPTGRGLFAFSSLDEAIGALYEVMVRYDLHQQAAREIAETCFDARVVLTRLIEDAFAHLDTDH
jgi:hypothetical protein